MRPQLSREPLATRDREAELRLALPHDVRDDPLQRLPHGELAPAVPDLEPVGQREAVFHDVVVEQRHARLEGERHGRAIFHPQEHRQGIDHDVVHLHPLHHGGGRRAVPVVRRVAPPAGRRRTLAHHGAIPVAAQRPAEQRIHAEHAAQPRRQVAVPVPDVQHVAIALQHGRAELLRQPDPPTRPEQRGEIGVAELRVTAEHLVAPLAVQQHLHTRVLGGPHDAPLRVVGHLPERHVLVPRHAREGLQEVVGRGEHEVRVGADRVRHRQRILPLVDLPLLVACREGVEAVPQGLGRVRLLAPDLPDQGHDRRRIEPARETAPHRHVADQVPPRRRQEQLTQPVDPRRVQLPVLGRRLEPPVGPRREPPGRRVQRERVGRRQRLHRREQGALAVVAIGVDQEAHHGLVVGPRLQAGVGKQRFDLGGEDERPRGRGIIERLDPEAVAGAEQPAPRTVPHGEREHAVEPRETVLTPPPVGLQQHLGVGARGEAVPQRLELGAQLLMVVDLAVEYDPDVGVAHREGLQAPVGQVEYREAPVAQPQRDGSGGIPSVGVGQKRVPEPAPPTLGPGEQEPLAVRPPMPLAIVHLLQRGHVDRSREADDPYDPAHRPVTSAASPRSGGQRVEPAHRHRAGRESRTMPTAVSTGPGRTCGAPSTAVRAAYVLSPGEARVSRAPPGLDDATGHRNRRYLSGTGRLRSYRRCPSADSRRGRSARSTASSPRRSPDCPLAGGNRARTRSRSRGRR